MSGVLAPSVWDVESAVDLLALLLLSPRSPFPPSLSSITKSMGILPFKQEMYRWQKLSHSSCTWKLTKIVNEYCDFIAKRGLKSILNSNTVSHENMSVS